MPQIQRKYQWQRDTADHRDHIFGLTAAKLPASVDLRSYCSPVEDQGDLGSCTGNAIAGMIELMDRKARLNLDVSRLFIYYEERVLEGTVSEDAGAFIRDGLKVVNKKGAPLESVWPYDITKFSDQPSTAAYADAANRKVTGYQRCLNLTAIKTALAAGTPCVIGFDVYSSFESATVARTGMMPYPNVRREELLGGHAVAVVGYNDRTNSGSLLCRNSWGTSWGIQGYFWMPYRVINDTNMSSDFWTISRVSNP